jgi:hypothetical protein
MPAPGSREAITAAVADRHPGTIHVARQFAWAHLPEHLAEVSRPVGQLALAMIGRLADGPELTAGLRKLLECKDCLVRARIDMDGSP